MNHWAIERIPSEPAIVERWGLFAVTGDVASHPTANVHSTARLVGPVVLGEGVSVGANAVIVGPTSLGPGTQVGAGALVSRSVTWNGGDIGEGAFVDASVIGDGLVIPAHMTVQNEIKVNRQRNTAPRLRLMPAALPPRPAPAGSAARLVFR